MIIYDDLPEYGRLISFPPSEALAALVEEDKRLALSITDASGNPSESHCASWHLDNILMVRDEDLARKAVQTVRTVEEL